MTRQLRLDCLITCLALAALAGCMDVSMDGNSNGNDNSDGQLEGDGPVAEDVSAKLGEPVPYATAEQLDTFERGREVALKRFDHAGGLGPAFNVTFCASCHERPVIGGSAALYRNFQLSGRVTDDGAFLVGESSGPAGGVLRVFSFDPFDPFRPLVPVTSTVFAQRNAIPFFGVGLIAELSEQEILIRADPQDINGDGISGRPNFDRGFVGRFGRKAQTVSIEGFIRGPLKNHLGVTTDPLTDQQRRDLPVDSSATAKTGAKILQAAAEDAPNSDADAAPDPEMTGQELFDLVTFSMLLAAPQVEPPSAETEPGRLLFRQAGCDDCHAPRLNGPRGPLPIYSDLLLHEMGDELADGIFQGEATGSEFRTQPLWGLAAVGPYLHDGRADTISAAILAHGGEAQSARDAFADMTDAEQADVVTFLMSLGGRDQHSTGLLPPGAAVPDVGEYGGPVRDLTDAEAARFARGRELYDHDFGHEAGVGGLTGDDEVPRFNGDSCRACHFDPVLGGGGPRGVNVMRHARIDTEGNYSNPTTTVNTILHKQSRVPFGPVLPTSEINFFEPRQTPHTFGLGLIDAISEDDILANADPDDVNSDGISGRANVLPGDGRIGRFGWKADVPSVAEFVRDAMAAEIGLTVEAQDGLTFGITEDGDDIGDPELTAVQADDLAFFISTLAGPPRQIVTGDDADQVAAGEVIFDAIGCTMCHMPSLPSSLGDVPLFSDLLLHEIMPADSGGIESGDATVTEFRTAPLWGLSQTAPYFHNGEADTIDEAVRMHQGEAANIRQLYENLTDEQRAQVLAFLNSL